MTISLPSGKGMYIWKAIDCEVGNPDAIADLAVLAGFGHVLIKIADGYGPYNISVNLPAIVRAIQQRGLQAWGWHYVYGSNPLAEADKAIERISYSGVDGYVIDAEEEYKLPGKSVSAAAFGARLRFALPRFPIGLSTYRYPTYHREFPWMEFRDFVDFDMPQVYWEQAHNPADQLLRSYNEYQAFSRRLPYVPTGAAYINGGWAPTPSDVNAFLARAHEMGLAGANFWEWANARRNLPAVWAAISAYSWPGQEPTPEPDPGGDPVDITPLVTEMQRMNSILADIRDKLQVSPTPQPDPEPSPYITKTVIVDKANARHVVGYNDADVPILEIYPTDQSSPSERVQYLLARVVNVYSDPMRADGGSRYWLIAEHEYRSGLPALYLRDVDVR